MGLHRRWEQILGPAHPVAECGAQVVDGGEDDDEDDEDDEDVESNQFEYGEDDEDGDDHKDNDGNPQDPLGVSSWVPVWPVSPSRLPLSKVWMVYHQLIGWGHRIVNRGQCLASLFFASFHDHLNKQHDSN